MKGTFDAKFVSARPVAQAADKVRRGFAGVDSRRNAQSSGFDGGLVLGEAKWTANNQCMYTALVIHRIHMDQRIITEEYTTEQFNFEHITKRK